MGINRDGNHEVMDRNTFYDKYARLTYGPEDRWEFMTDLAEVVKVESERGKKKTPDVERGASKKPSKKGKDTRKKGTTQAGNVVRGMGTTKGL